MDRTAYRTPSEAARAFRTVMVLLLRHISELPSLEKSRAEKIPPEAVKSFEQVVSVEDDQRPRWIEKTRDLLTELERLLAGQRMLFSAASRIVARYLEAEDASALFREALDILDHIEETIQADTMRQMGIKPRPKGPSERKPKAPKTYAKAQLEILVHLGRKGWALSKALKVPYATSPDGTVRLWFKAQAIYMSQGEHVNDMGSAHSIFADDYRFIPVEDFVKVLERIAARAGAKLASVDQVAELGTLNELLGKISSALILLKPNLSWAEDLVKKEGFEKADLKKHIGNLHEAVTKYLRYVGVR